MKVFDELSLYSELQGCTGVCVCAGGVNYQGILI